MNDLEKQAVLDRYRVRVCRSTFGTLIPEMDPSHIDLIIMAAVECRSLLFIASLTDPTSAELDDFFDEFVSRALRTGVDYVQ